jgi:hypothetical protein
VLVDSMDGIYFLASPSFDSDEPPVPEDVGSLGIAVAPEIVGISTFGSWAPVDLTIEQTPYDVGLQDMGAWDAVVESEVVASGPLTIVNQDFEPVEARGAQITSAPGRFGVRVQARSVEGVIKFGTLLGDEPTEQHIIYIWPLDA